MAVLPPNAHISLLRLYDEALEHNVTARPDRIKYVQEKTAGTFQPTDVKQTLDKLIEDRRAAR
jgi:hypothetical protein